MYTIRKAQIQSYKAQLALTAALREEVNKDMKNEAKAAAFGTAANILDAMRNAGYAPQSFGAGVLETGDETPAEMAEIMAGLDY